MIIEMVALSMGFLVVGFILGTQLGNSEPYVELPDWINRWL